jgi:hypothetical protein
MFKNIQNYLITTYRTIAISILIIIITGVLSYLFLLTFYFVNTNWGTPLILSPSQQHVLAFQPQIAALESTILKQKVELATANNKYYIGIKQQLDIQKFLARAKVAQYNEAKILDNTNSSYIEAIKEKTTSISSNESLTKTINSMSESIDLELKANLITKDQADSRKLMLQSANNNIVDSRVQVTALKEQARIASDNSSTLAGKSSNSIQALRSIQEQVQLRNMLAQIEIDTETAKQTIEQLDVNIKESARVLSMAKTSPYYLALRETQVVVFVPYKNLSKIEIGSNVYDCYLQVFLCHKVGEVITIYEAEELSRHPLFKNDIKGRFVGIKLEYMKYAESGIVFINSKPLLL